MMSNFIHKSRIVIFRQTSEDDLSFVMETEREPENAQFITQWSFEQHRDVMNNETMAHWIIQAAHDNRRLGYIILDGIDNPNKSIEFKRIALREKGQGFGRESVRLLKSICFTLLHAHRLWLDVMEDNNRAIWLYTSEGFIKEGMLREALKIGDRYVSLIVMSVLQSEDLPVY